MIPHRSTDYMGALRAWRERQIGRPPLQQQDLAPADTPTPHVTILIDTSNAADQSQSPLFSKIPPELRNEIFALALQPYVDPEKLYERETFWARPGFEGRKKMDVALVGSCKRVYEETKAVVMRQGFEEMVVFLGHGSRAPRNYSQITYSQHGIYTSPATKYNTAAQWRAINHVHVYGQMYAVQSGLQQLFNGGPASRQGLLQPSSLTLTLRYTDWWFWEDNQAIYPLNPARFFDMKSLTLPDSITKVTVEFENIKRNVQQLDGVVRDMFVRGDWWYWKRKDGRKLVVKRWDEESKTGGTRAWEWTGPTRFGEGNRRFGHHGEGDDMVYVVREVTWEVERE